MATAVDADGMIWVRQFRHALAWANAFLAGQTGSITREFYLGADLRMGRQTEVTIDASPWAEEGFLTIDNIITSWFAEPI